MSIPHVSRNGVKNNSTKSKMATTEKIIDLFLDKKFAISDKIRFKALNMV